MAERGDNRPNSETDLSRRLISAYSQRYREAARWKTAAWIGSALLFVAGLGFGAAGEDASGLGLLASGYLLCSRLVLRPEMTRAHREAVALQEFFDTRLFSLPWNPGLVGKLPALVDVEDLARRFSGDASGFSTWYVGASAAPPGARVLLWQLENVSWGRRDHRRFAVFSAIVLVLSAGATVVVGLARDISLTVYVSVLAAPALPWLLDVADLTTLHWRAAGRRGEIEAELTETWRTAAGNGAIPAETLRAAQDRIFAARRSTGRVPTWFYRLYRTRNQAAFAAAAAQMLDERGWSGDA